MPRGRSTEWTVNTTGLRDLSRALRRIGPTFPRQLGKALRVGAEFVAVDARERASWSKRIPGTVKVGGGVSAVTISAGGSRAPHAAAFENRGKEGMFRHPVFGPSKKHEEPEWVDQQARPFLAPAVEAKAPQIAAAIDAAIDETLNTI
jgi:hypothetical protein